MQLNLLPQPAATSARPLRARPAALPTPSTSAGSPDDCPICIKLAYRRKRDKGAVQWVECDKCETCHWACAKANPLDAIDMVDKWYCPACITASAALPTPLLTTYKSPPRKSDRPSQRLDYANLDAHLPADVSHWLRVLETRKVTDGNKEGRFKRFANGVGVTEWLASEEGMKEPCLIYTPEGLGMKMPDRAIGIDEIARKVGLETPVEVIDVASQSSLRRWTLAQWAEYYMDPNRDKVRNVISLEVSDSGLAKGIEAPQAVRNIDWVETIWPPELKGPGQYPRVQKYCLMSVARCWTDWHIDFAGSSVYYHVLRGGKVFYFIRPTSANLAAYEAWSGNAEKQESTWLGDNVDEVIKITLGEGNTMIIPTGWIHAVFTPCDSLVFGGNFLHSFDIGTQLRVYEIELATKVPKKFRFPHFVKLLWFVARHYAEVIPISPSGTSPTTLPQRRVLEGLKKLSTFLIEQTTRIPKEAKVSNERRRIARENVPWDWVKDPVALAQELKRVVLKALGEELGQECFTPMGEKGKVENKEPSSKRKAQGLPTTTAQPTQRVKTGAASKAFPKDDGKIIGRSVVTVPTVLKQELRVEPGQEGDGVAYLADVVENKFTKEVIRRHIDEKGSVIIETRTVITKIERVKFPPVSPSSALPAPSTPILQILPALPTSPVHPAVVAAEGPVPPCSRPDSLATHRTLTGAFPSVLLVSTPGTDVSPSPQQPHQAYSSLLPPPLSALFPQFSPLLPAGGLTADIFSKGSMLQPTSSEVGTGMQMDDRRHLT